MVLTEEYKEYSQADFEKVPEDRKLINDFVRPSVSYWRDVWNRLRRDKVALVSMIAIVVIILAAIIVPEVMPHKFDDNFIAQGWQSKSPSTPEAKENGFIFGTDVLGRDLFVRTFYGARYSMLIGFLAAAVNLLIGVIYGGISGYFGGRLDNIMMRIVDILYSIPLMIFVILLMSILNKPGSGGSEIGTIILAFTISYWINMARIVRGEVMQLKGQEFVLAAQALGASKKRILLKHLVPNAMGSIVVTTMLLVPQAIFLEAFLSFLGLGLSQPKASLGSLANEALATLYTFPYQMFFPAAMICVIILAFNLFGDGLRDALDPKMKK